MSGFGCLFKAIDSKQLKLSPVRIADVMRNETDSSIAYTQLMIQDLSVNWIILGQEYPPT